MEKSKKCRLLFLCCWPHIVIRLHRVLDEFALKRQGEIEQRILYGQLAQTPSPFGGGPAAGAGLMGQMPKAPPGMGTRVSIMPFGAIQPLPL